MANVNMGGKNMEQVVTSEGAGLQGVVNTTDTTAVTGNFTAVQCIEDTVFATLTEADATGSLTGVTIPAGTTLFGRITAYTLTSGKVRAYKA